MLETNNEDKQDLLRTEIIEKNYDQNKFVNLCLSKKENGDDIENWTIEELKQLIQEFHSQEAANKKNQQDNQQDTQLDNQQGNQQDIQLDNQQEEEITNKSLPSINDKIQSEPSEEEKQQQEIKEGIENIKMKEQPKENKAEVFIEIKCKQLEKTILNDKNVKVIIQNPTTVEQSFLSSNYVKYEVVTETKEGWKVYRRYNDFLWLRSLLIKYNPGQVIPPLPNKKMGSRRFEEDFIKKRMFYLQKFMDSVIQNEYFKASEPLISFLSMSDRGMFEAKQRELSSYIPSPLVEDFRTFSGNVKIAKEEVDNEKYFTNISNYFRIQNILYLRVKEHMKSFYLKMNEACQALGDVQKDFETFTLLNERVLMKKPITRSYEQIGVFIKNWKRLLGNQNDIFKTHFKDFFKFIAMEGTSYEELIKNREKIKIKYLAKKTDLMAKKEKMWQNKDPDKWEIIDDFNKVNKELAKTDKNYAMKVMCTSETRELESMKSQFGYVNKMNFDELKKMIDTNCERFINNLSKFLEVFYPSLTDGINVFSGMQMFVATANSNIQL